MLLGMNSENMVGRIKVWNGKQVMGEDEQTMVAAWKSQFLAVCGQLGTKETLLSGVDIGVGLEG